LKLAIETNMGILNRKLHSSNV